MLGILPLGTANDFATSAGIPEDPEAALRLAIVGEAVNIDGVRESDALLPQYGDRRLRHPHHDRNAGKAEVGAGRRLLLYSRTDAYGYAEGGQLRHQRPQLRWTGDALAIGVGNGRQAGGGQRLCPRALINDGLLDLSVVTSQELLSTLLHSVTSDEQNPNIIAATLPSLTITSPNEMTFNLDGEPLSGTGFHIEVLPGALACRLPPQCPLLT